MAHQNRKGSFGSIGGGCFIWVLVLAAWGITTLIFPKLPGYEQAMEQGAVIDGEVTGIETVESVTINDRHPRRVLFSYGDEKGSMTLAMGESAKVGQRLKVRVMDGQAYPEKLRPLTKPGWLKFALIGGIGLGVLMIGQGVLRLLVIGGVLFSVGRALTKKEFIAPTAAPAERLKRVSWFCPMK